MDGENEIVDAAVAIREKCQNTVCKAFKEKFDACNERSTKSGNNENCEEELFDFLKCVDPCVSIFNFI
jgi:hypothetical protein